MLAPTTGRGLSRAGRLAAAIGLALLTLMTVDGVYAAAAVAINAALALCLAAMIAEWSYRVWVAIRVRRASVYAASFAGIADAAGALAVPIAFAVGVGAQAAWLCAVVWVLKLVPGISGLRQLRRVMVLESASLISVAVIFLTVLFVASVAEFALEHEAQPAAFSSLPATFWWAVTTLTTTGYGDVVPVTPLGRVVGALVMISGLGVFGLWTGILATGFAAETRRENFLKTWEAVSRVPFFAALGPSAIAGVTNMLRTIDLPPRVTIIKKGQPGDCMYFIASGEVEVDLPGKKVRLGPGAFFGEMALLGNNVRSANITTTTISRLLILDLVDFRVLMARHPDLAATIDAEARRRAAENS
ncbi:cyclic nucleotide-gated ion channel [Rhodopseudomonas sp. B29]|uniref:cyclic nucleotide-gated ion channel n=1 Tax=Rhodopseudomonas sp. B29 TaxID=95607 RepID=UPI0003458007|nr:cyclic nucleotide-gated ion channel [Rhodopseudomonas sp. B29]